MIDWEHLELSVRRQCELLGLNRSTLYYEAVPETAENLCLMRLIDEEYTRHPFYGSRKMTKWLVEQGHEVNRKRVQRLLRVMGLEAIYPKPKLSAGGNHKVYPHTAQLKGKCLESQGKSRFRPRNNSGFPRQCDGDATADYLRKPL